MSSRTLRSVPGRYSVCRLPPAAPIPGDALTRSADFLSVTRTSDELTVICAEDVQVPGAVRDSGWHCLRVAGMSGLDEPGVLSSVVAPLADAGLSVFAVATYDTDYLLVTELQAASKALAAAGHRVVGAADD
ncbi:ACT domain-containing protein [Amycolatopsis sp. FU40]|uniref:ACT domain-containing protein n=1 Tax=Amycolatopsis sp. FU40 TaxID=2914159 RepID=UPI001F292F8A|nr:ACT domain-containing protein [Amycolatopsis sp. FU40]UKD58042.1 ACT domain-containing protein [Amycolatopsis sp. FU40]